MVLWTRPLVTGLVFLAGLNIFYLVLVQQYSTLTLLGRSACCAIISHGLARLVHKPNLRSRKSDSGDVFEECLINPFQRQVASVMADLWFICSWKSAPRTLKGILAMVLLFVIVNSVTLAHLLLFLYIGAFCVALLYKRYGDHCDHVCGVLGNTLDASIVWLLQKLQQIFPSDRVCKQD